MPSPKDLQQSGLKATMPRMKILEVFEKHRDAHLTADDVYRILVTDGLDIGLATVYRALTQFEQAGLLQKQNFESGKAVFELNRGDHHDHLVCLQCDRVVEFCDPEIERKQAEIAENGLSHTGTRSVPVRRLCGPELSASTHQEGVTQPSLTRSSALALEPQHLRRVGPGSGCNFYAAQHPGNFFDTRRIV